MSEDLSSLRLLITERLTAAAEEIFCVFGRAMVDLQEKLNQKTLELDRHRRLMELSVKPHVKIESQHGDLPQLQENISTGVSPQALEELLEDLPHVKEEPEETWMAEETEGGAEGVTDGDHVIKMTLIKACGTTDLDPEGPNDTPAPPLTDQSEHHPMAPNGMDGGAGTSATQTPPSSSQHVTRCRAPPPRSGLLPYACSVCGKAFAVRTHWAAHVRAHRGHLGGGGVGAYRDRGRSSGGASRSGGATSGASDGGGSKSFRCDICGKWLTRLDGLEKHLRVHTGEKPYGCPQCGKRFSDNSNYKRHIRRHASGWSRGAQGPRREDANDDALQDSGTID